MNRAIKSVCLAGVTGLALLAPSVAYAAESPRGQAEAVNGTLVGNPLTLIGQDTAANAQGPAVQPLSLLEGQSLVTLGALVQQAVAHPRNGTSAACAGLAGAGSGTVTVGDPNCIEDGDDGVRLVLAELDLSSLLDVQLTSGSLGLGGLVDLLDLNGVAQVLDGVDAALTPLRTGLAEAQLVLDAGVVEATCVAGPNGVEGDSRFAGARLQLVVPGLGEIALTDVEATPSPGSRLDLNLDGLRPTLRGAVSDSLLGELADLQDTLPLLTDGAVDGVVNAALGMIDPLLEELQTDVLTAMVGTPSASENSVEVTALQLRLLPGADQFGLPEALDLSIGSVACTARPRAVDEPGDGPGDGPDDEPGDGPDDEPGDGPDAPESDGPGTNGPGTNGPGSNESDDGADRAGRAPPSFSSSSDSEVPSSVNSGVGFSAEQGPAAVAGLLASVMVLLGIGLVRGRRTSGA